MMKVIKFFWVYIVVGIAMVTGSYAMVFSENDSTTLKEVSLQLTTEVINVKGGYGYTILYNDKVIIQQEHIPVVSGSKVFCSKEDALKTAGLVKSKLLKTGVPTISLKELDSINVSLYCN